MITDRIPIEVLQNMLKTAHDEATANFAKSVQNAGRTLPPETAELTSICADIAQLYFLSMIKQIDFYEAAQKAPREKSEQ